MQSREDLYARINNRIIADLEKGVHPWFKPWSAGNTEGRIARPLRFNFQPYTGVNTLTLWCDMVEKDYRNPVHMTYGCAEEVWYGWWDSDRGIIYRRWHATARDFGANSGFGLGFFCALAGSRHTAGVIRPMTGEGAPSWRSPDWPGRTAYGAVRCSC